MLRFRLSCTRIVGALRGIATRQCAATLAESPAESLPTTELTPQSPSKRSDLYNGYYSTTVERVLRYAYETDKGMPKKWLSVPKQQLLQDNSTSPAVSDKGEEHVHFVNVFASYIKVEANSERLLSSSSPVARLHAQQWRRVHKAVCPSPMERQVLLHKACDIVEKREVSLTVATRLLRRRWPRVLLEGSGAAQYRFLTTSIVAWLSASLREKKLTPIEARAVLGNSALALKGMPSSLVGGLALLSLSDVEKVEHPDALIALLWAVHTSGAHAPDMFWRTVLLRLTALNRTLRGRMSGVMSPDSTTTSSGDKAVGLPSYPKERGEYTGHVFSGLTTRQIYRLLEVLRRERWCGDVAHLHDLADQALKNVVFETEAANFPPKSSGRLTKRDITRRVMRVADLSPTELLGLLAISGDLGIPFGVSAARVSDQLLLPIVRYLHRDQLLMLLKIIRQTRCHSPLLVAEVAKRVQLRGESASYTLPLCKGIVRTLLKEPELLSQMDPSNVLAFFLKVCEVHKERVRGSELANLADLLYVLSRRYAPDSPLGLSIRHTVDELALQLNRLLQLQVVPSLLATRLLEHTIVLGMRNSGGTYPNTVQLLATRNAAVHNEHAEAERRLAQRSSSVPSAEDETGYAVRGRWESTPEEELPSISRASVQVYHEMIYLFERMAVIRASLTNTDMARFSATMERTGVYNIFLGAFMMKQGHLAHSHNSDGSPPSSELPHTLPYWMEKRIGQIMMCKIRLAALTTESSNDEVLHVLGQVHCDAAKVRKLVNLIQHSPLELAKRQRDVWIFVSELARRFGEVADEQAAQDVLAKALY